MVLTLTDRFVATIRPKGVSTRIFDTKARGLVLRVGARTKVWYFAYRNGGTPQWLKLGSYPSVGLAEARKLALDRRHDLDVKGIDPAVERRKSPVVEPAPAIPTIVSPELVAQLERALAAVVVRTIRQEFARHGQDAH